MMRKSLFLYIFLSLFVLASCEKQIDDGKGKSDTEQPVTPPDSGDEDDGGSNEPGSGGDAPGGSDEGGSGGGGDEGGSGGGSDEGGTEDSKGSIDNPYTVHDFLVADVLSQGYIVGYIVGDITGGWNNARFEAPFQEEPVAILLADSPDETAKDAVMYLKLDKNSGERTALSLTHHPENLHKKIKFHSGASIGTSYGIRGIDKLNSIYTLLE